ncbi:unnamed protein product [Mytilus coruscus]|uniref:Uncharacterized protein n=1 Tax=Mytilus coruscus TaxID=42192 RepID=A0A6J8EPY6_MYTCO|nr:unnamed protein product [Mytilus coruscus]
MVDIELLDRRLLGIKIPEFFSRRQRTLHDHTHWKASEMREWLLHFSVPVLENLLAPEPYLHYILLVSGISTLVRDDLKKIDADYAESCLIDFCEIYPKIYDDKIAKEILSLGKKINLPTQSPHYLLLSREMRDNGVKVFCRLQFRGTVFYSKGYQDAKTRNDSACCFSHNNVTKKGIILLFLEYENQINVIIQECFSVPFNLGEDIRRQINNCTLKAYLDKTICRHIEKIEGFSENIVISAKKLLKKCVLMEIYNSESFISIPPNTSEHN